MKKFSLLILAVSFYLGVNAQNDSKNNNLNPPHSYVDTDTTIRHHADGYMMKNGKMVIVKDGKITSMEQDITLPDGTVIMRNGSYEKKNGVKRKLKEGEHVDMMGKLNPMNSGENSFTDPNLKSKNAGGNQSPRPKKNKDMILIPDSTRKKKTW